MLFIFSVRIPENFVQNVLRTPIIVREICFEEREENFERNLSKIRKLLLYRFLMAKITSLNMNEMLDSCLSYAAYTLTPKFLNKV